jgi:hypothetical protein
MKNSKGRITNESTYMEFNTQIFQYARRFATLNSNLNSCFYATSSDTRAKERENVSQGSKFL